MINRLAAEASNSIRIWGILMGYFLDAIRQFADFSGRATRKEYWMFVLFYMIIYVLLSVVDGLLGMTLLETVFAFVVLVPSISVGARRLHDTGRTGWWQLIALIPVIGAIILIVFLAQGSKESNAYGPGPQL